MSVEKRMSHPEPSMHCLYIQLMSTYAPAFGFGGPIRLMYEYAKWMVGAGFRVTAITGGTNRDSFHLA